MTGTLANGPVRTAVITGGNSGLGHSCAKALLTAQGDAPWHLVLACRDTAKAESVAESLRKEAGAAKVSVMPLDLASLASVRSFAGALKEKLSTGEMPALKALVCNAAVQGAKKFTPDGFESTFGVNHLGHFLLVELLKGSLSPGSRVTVVASGVHDPTQTGTWSVPAPAWNDPDALARGELGPASKGDDEGKDRMRRYGTSKLANVYFTYALARRLPEGVTANAFDPGLMPGTGLTRAYPAPMLWLWMHVMPRIIPLLRLAISPNIHTADESGAALARLAAGAELAGVNGKYFEGRKEIRSSDESYDKGRADELWDASLRLTGVV